MMRVVRRIFDALVGTFLAGLLFVLPTLLTLAILGWAATYARHFLGPDSFLGHGLAVGISLVTGVDVGHLSFLLGLLFVVLVVMLIGLVVKTRLRRFLDRALNGLMDRVPLIRSVYRPVSQVVRLVGSNRQEGELKGMQVAAARLGDTHCLCLLVTSEIFTIEGAPRQLVLVPSAPVPVGGAMLFVAPEKVTLLPDFSLEEFMKFYVSMGAAVPVHFTPDAPSAHKPKDEGDKTP